MIVFETVLGMLAVGVLVLGLARRGHLPYPVLLALAGVAIAFAPFHVEFHLEPSLVLALFVAPVLLDAAYDTSLRDLRRNWGAVLSLALVAVGLTTAAVALVVHTLVPTIPWAAAIAIGAIVAPPDAVATTTVLQDVRLPHRVSVILRNEALLNDASTLLIYRLALTAVASGGGVGAEVIAPAFLLSAVGSVVAGLGFAWVVGSLTRRIADAPSSIIFQFVSTFGVWTVSERLGMSPILTIVAYGMTLARLPAAYQSARLRIPSFAVWETAVVVLNVLAFLIIGLELGAVIASAPPGELGRWTLVGAAVLATVIAVRLAWTLAAALWSRRQLKRNGRADLDGAAAPDWRSGLVIGWAGTRGIVTVATALALPGDFPERGMLLFCAFAVTLGTLVIQGPTLRPLVRMLRLRDDGPVEREVRTARVAMADAGLAAVQGDAGPGAAALRQELEFERRVASEASDGDGRPTPPEKSFRASVLAKRRLRLLELRRDGTIGDDAFHVLEEELDLADLATATRT